MAKILKNTTENNIFITDTGVSITANGQYTIPPTDYLLWSSSSNAVTHVGNGTLVINDGSYDLSISDGMDFIKGIFPAKVKIENAPGSIVVVQDDDALVALNNIAAGLGVSGSSSVFKKNEASVTVRTEFDLSNTTYTVPSGKKFFLTSFSASYDAQAALYVRLKKQTGGSGAWETMFRLNMMSGGQGNSTLSYDLGSGINIGDTGDVFKITIESSIAKGSIFASFGGSQV